MLKQNFDEIFQSDEFLVNLVASTPNVLYKMLNCSDSIKPIKQILENDHSATKELVNYLSVALEQKFDKNIKHPSEIIICSGLVLLSPYKHLPIVKSFIENCLNLGGKSCTWIRMIASIVISKDA